jgi:hypothetical protein
MVSLYNISKEFFPQNLESSNKSSPTEFIKTLESSTNELIDLFPPPIDSKCRGEQKCYYFGHWRES